MKYIYGLNKSGESIINYLNKTKEQYCCWDDDERVRLKLLKKNKKIKFLKPLDLDYELIDDVYVTPGISLNDSKISTLRNKGLKLYRDLNLYLKSVDKQKIIAITGTNGKSTTTKLISDLLTGNNVHNFYGGNIGVPLLNFANFDNKVKFHVIELSSFQLESLITFNPYISILLNISPDHLDRYRNYDDYIKQKSKIINYNHNGYNIIAVDDQETKKIYEKNKNKDKTIPVSLESITKGIFFENDYIVDCYFENYKKIKISNLSPYLFGLFNKQNILVSYAVNKILDLKEEKFLKILDNFIGLPHRLESIYQNDDIQIIDNSKATNLESTLKAIINYENIYLILGGVAKEKDFSELLKYKKNIKKIYLIGDSAVLISNHINKKINYEICMTLNKAIDRICIDIKVAQNNQVILFSPACSSFDQFENFEDRGKTFKKLIYKKFNV